MTFNCLPDEDWFVTLGFWSSLHSYCLLVRIFQHSRIPLERQKRVKNQTGLSHATHMYVNFIGIWNHSCDPNHVYNWILGTMIGPYWPAWPGVDTWAGFPNICGVSSEQKWCFSVEPDHSMATRELFHWKETYGSSVSTMPGHSVKLNGCHREEDHVSMSVHSAKFPSITLRMIEITEIGISIHCSHLRTFRDDVWAIFVWQRNLIYANWRSLENYGHGSFTAVHFRVRRVIGAVGSKNWSFRPPGPPLLGHWTSGPSGSKYYIFLFIYF